MNFIEEENPERQTYGSSLCAFSFTGVMSGLVQSGSPTNNSKVLPQYFRNQECRKCFVDSDYL